MRRAVVLLTHRPHESQVDFYLQFERLGYDVFVVVDDNECDVSGLRAKVIQVNDAECAARGFKNFCASPKPLSWDKAVYYFSCVDCSHEHIWFIQDDVFLTSHETLVGVDRACPDADIISETNEVNLQGSRDRALWWWWPHVPSALPAPWAKSATWATRLSRGVLEATKTLVETGIDGLPYIGFVFHTLAGHKGLKVVTPEEMQGLVWGKKWSPEEMTTGFYYPVPYVGAHPQLRQLLHAMRR